MLKKKAIHGVIAFFVVNSLMRPFEQTKPDTPIRFHKRESVFVLHTSNRTKSNKIKSMMYPKLDPMYVNFAEKCESQIDYNSQWLVGVIKIGRKEITLDDIEPDKRQFWLEDEEYTVAHRILECCRIDPPVRWPKEFGSGQTKCALTYEEIRFMVQFKWAEPVWKFCWNGCLVLCRVFK